MFDLILIAGAAIAALCTLVESLLKAQEEK